MTWPMPYLPSAAPEDTFWTVGAAPTTWVGGVGGGVGVGVAPGTGAVATVVSALFTLTRPNACPAIGSVAPRICVDAALLLLPLATSRAARPAVSAAAGDVPVIAAYVPPGCVAVMATPGAATAALPVLLFAPIASF